MSNLPQDTEKFLFNPGLSSFSSESEPAITSREQRSEIRAIKSEIAQHGQILSSLSTQLSKLVDLFAATPTAGEPQTPVTSPPETRRTSQVFSPSHGNTAIQPGQSITVMSTKLAESAPILSNFTLYDVILYTRAYIDWTIRAGPTTIPPPFCTGLHGDILETVCTELQMQYQDLVVLSTSDILKLLNKYFLDSGLMYQFQDALRGVRDRLSEKNYFKMPTDRDLVQHTVFIARWTWILENFPCVEHIGRQNLLLILPTLIPISNFRVLVQEQKFSSLEDFFTLLRTLGNDYNTHIRVQKSIVRLNNQLAARLNKETHAQTGVSSSNTPPTGGMSQQKGQSDRRSGPFSRANSVKSTEEVHSPTTLIFDTGAEHSFVPPSIPFPPSSPHHDDAEVILPDGHVLPVSGRGILGSDICLQVPGLHTGLLGSSAVRDNLVTIFDDTLIIFKPTAAVANSFKRFLLSTKSHAFIESPRDVDNLFRIPIDSFTSCPSKYKKLCLTRYFTVS